MTPGNQMFKAVLRILGEAMLKASEEHVQRYECDDDSLLCVWCGRMKEDHSEEGMPCPVQ